MSEAVVVGSGPNGLAAAVALALRGVSVTVLEAAGEIGGGARSGELDVPGVVHDHCSAAHPTGVGSPFLRMLPLERYGLRWRWPEVDLAHPLDDGSAGVMLRSVADTAALLGADGGSWRALFEPLAADFDAVAAEIMRPVTHLPAHPVALARFGLRAVQPATVLARRWRTAQARALFAGTAAHAFRPLHSPVSAAIGVMMTAAGHRYGWPVAEGGSGAVTGALARMLRAHGGRIETGVRVRSLAELPAAEAVLLDVSPQAAVELAGDRLPVRVRRAYERFRRAPGAFKVDLVVEGGVPWRNEHCRRAGFVHVGGTLEEVAHAEREVVRGRMPARPVVLVAQQYLADPGRSRGDLHPVWTYAHVPHGYPGDATPVVLEQLERFAPGLRERVVAVRSRSTAEMARYNPNYAGGDIIMGANTPVQAVLRPRVAWDPYRTGVPGVYLCSAATPPGAGVHGMCGFNAARSALRSL
ncbi:dehydrogenase [Saccharopolyspora erythraea NRRL 2338]|uniref:Dehydrogenase n=2 Tax=Saccharopolyspora erythraea TaxID=1836 RepID=A4FG22_SACEN|nr:NAD(P)/FAD-dependent oxidoreductase [Saccharopolyspora erythraea]QRK86959.1 NAD(P)/FAD-dependent oxidoreductase [Saccharopolyspora erythraea]CAM02997.1 dehydrogenase [Saccharopolyspora erythraea NRRL 2338]